MIDFSETQVEVYLKHGEKIYEPVVVGEITVEWIRFGTPGKMTLTVYKDDVLKFEEGDTVRLKVNGKKFFYGFLFTYERQDPQRY